MSKGKQHYCYSCGEDLGVFDAFADDYPLTCGNAECVRQARRDEREAEAEREESARDDRFSRY